MLVSSLCSNGARIRLADAFLSSCRGLSSRAAFSTTTRPILGQNSRNVGVRKLSPYSQGVARTKITGSFRNYAAIAERQPKVKVPEFITPTKASPLLKSTSGAAESAPLPVLSPPSVAKWLMGCSVLVFGIVVVGGVTRLTESGLSITEWRPITGILPPLSTAEWNVEFDKYKATPEFKL